MSRHMVIDLSNSPVKCSQ